MKTSLRLASLVLSCVLACSFGVVAKDAKKEEGNQRPESVYKALQSHKDLSKFLDFVDDADAKTFFSNPHAKLTVFAPDNEAMSKISSAEMKMIKENKSSLLSFVKGHAIAGSLVFSTAIKGRKASPSSSSGTVVPFDGTSGDLKVGSGKVVTSDLMTGNGVVHIVSAALVPQAPRKEDDKAALEKQAKEREAQEALTLKDKASQVPSSAQGATEKPEASSPSTSEEAKSKKKWWNVLSW